MKIIGRVKKFEVKNEDYRKNADSMFRTYAPIKQIFKLSYKE